MDNSFGRLYYQTMRQQNSQVATTGVNLMIGHLIRNDVNAASKIDLGLVENQIPEALKTYARTIRDIGSRRKTLDSNICDKYCGGNDATLGTITVVETACDSSSSHMM